MSTDLDYLKSQTQAMFKGPMHRYQQMAAEEARKELGGQIQYEAAEAQATEAQDVQAQAFEQQGQEMFGVMADVESKIEDIKLKGKFNSALYDKKNRELFGGYSSDKIPKGVAAAKKTYGDALYLQYLGDEFGEVVGKNNRRTLDAKAQGARAGLIEAVKHNYGSTDEEVETYMQRHFGEAEDRVASNRRTETAKSAVYRTASALGHTLLKSLEKLQIIDAPFLEGGMKFSNVMNMSSEELKAAYPEQAEMLARAITLDSQEDLSSEEKKEKNWLKEKLKADLPRMTEDYLKPLIATEAGLKQGLQEANRIIMGGQYDPAVLNKFINNVTDNPKYQKILSTVMPMTSVVPLLAAEKFAANVALKTPAYAFRAGYANKALGKVLDILVPGRPSAWDTGHAVAVNAAMQSARKAAYSKEALVTDRAATQLGGEPVDPVADEAARILGGIVNGNLSDGVTRRAAAETVRRIDSAANATPAEKELAETLRSQVQQANAQAGKDAGKSVPVQINVQEGAGALDRLGYSDELIHRLVRTEDEAKRFQELVEEGRQKAGDLDASQYYVEKFGPGGGFTDASWAGLEAERADRSVLYAIMKFAEETGRPFRDIALPEVSPGSFAEFTDDTLRLRLEPNRYEVKNLTPAPSEVTQYFFGSGGARSWTKAVENLKTQVMGGGTDVTTARTGPMLWGDKEVVGVNPEDFAEMGEIFRVPFEQGRPIEEYTKEVYNAFVNRFGATKNEIATGKNLYDDMTPELKTPFSGAQIAKVEEIVNTWRGLKWLMRNAAGTDMEENAVNLALWYRSQIANGGTSYRLIHARTESWNRAARGVANDTTWGTPRPTDYRATELPDKTYLRGEGGLLRSALDTDQATVRTKLSNTEEKTGQVFSGEPSSEVKGRQIKAGQQHGAEGPDVTTAREDDAMASAVSMERLLRAEQNTGISSDQFDLGKVARTRVAEDAAQMQPVPEGPVNAATHSLEGTFEDLYVLDLEEFAGVSATAEAIAKEGKLNIFHIGPEHFDVLTDDKLYKSFVDNQIGQMANRIANNGAYEEQMLLFHRAMAIAKGMREMKASGKISAATETWLKDMDLRAGARGGTDEEAIIAGLESASDRYGFAFNMQKDYQKVVDVRTAELYDSLTTQAGRERFIDDYAEMMTGEEAVRMRREVNQAVNRIKKNLGGACG